MTQTRFEWDPAKDRENQKKHGILFSEAKAAFADARRVIAEDLSHGSGATTALDARERAF